MVWQRNVQHDIDTSQSELIKTYLAKIKLCDQSNPTCYVSAWDYTHVLPVRSSWGRQIHLVRIHVVGIPGLRQIEGFPLSGSNFAPQTYELARVELLDFHILRELGATTGSVNYKDVPCHS